MRAQKIWFGVLAVLCAVALAAALVWMFVPAAVEPEVPEPRYLLMDQGGKLALYSPDGGTFMEEYEVYTRLLPGSDQAALAKGVPVYNDAELESLLEDYGL